MYCTKVVSDAQNECRSMRREHVNNTCCQHLGGGLTLKVLHTHSALCSMIPGKQEIFILCPWRKRERALQCWCFVSQCFYYSADAAAHGEAFTCWASVNVPTPPLWWNFGWQTTILCTEHPASVEGYNISLIKGELYRSAGLKLFKIKGPMCNI